MKTGIVFLLLAIGLICSAIYLATDTRANIKSSQERSAGSRPKPGEGPDFRGAQRVENKPVGDATTDEDIARQLRNLEHELHGTGTDAGDFSIENAIANQEFSLTPLQKQVRDTPPIARLKTVLRDEGFVVLDSGLDQNLRPGMNLAVRRDYYIVAKLIVGDTVDTTESIANIAPNTVPTGIELRQGDAVIPWADIVALRKAP